MPNYDYFETIYYRQTDREFRSWLLALQMEFKKTAGINEVFKICEKTAKAAYVGGMTPRQCLSEQHYE